MSDMLAYAKQLILMRNILRSREDFKKVYSYAIISLLKLTNGRDTINEDDINTSILQAETHIENLRETPKYYFQVFEENILRVWRISKRESTNKLEREIFFSYGIVGLLIAVSTSTDINKGIENEIRNTKKMWEEYKDTLKQKKIIEIESRLNKNKKDLEEIQREEYLRYLSQYDEDYVQQKTFYSPAYLSVGNLPEPFDSEEKEVYLFGWYKATGEDEIDPKLRNLVWQRNLRLVAQLSIKYCNIAFAEELYSIGVDSLQKAIVKFKPSLGIEFGSFASRVIINDFLMCKRKLDRDSHYLVHLDDVISRDKNGNEKTYGDTLSYAEETIENICIRKEEIAELRLIIKDLSERDEEIVQLRHLNDPTLTQKEVSETLGISQSYVSRLEKRLVKELKDLLYEHD